MHTEKENKSFLFSRIFIELNKATLLDKPDLCKKMIEVLVEKNVFDIANVRIFLDSESSPNEKR